jgi:hypothetical protein
MTPARVATENCHDTLKPVTGKSGKGTARQTIRVDEQVWERFRATCDAAGGQDRSAVVRAFINWFNSEPEAELPTRPEVSVPQAIETDEEN